MKTIQYQKIEITLSRALGVENPANIRIVTLIAMTIFGMAFSMNAAILFVDRGTATVVEIALASLGIALAHAALAASGIGAEDGHDQSPTQRLLAAGLDLIGAVSLCYICHSVVIHDFIDPSYRSLNSLLMLMSVIALSAVVTRKFSKLL